MFSKTLVERVLLSGLLIRRISWFIQVHFRPAKSCWDPIGNFLAKANRITLSEHEISFRVPSSLLLLLLFWLLLLLIAFLLESTCAIFIMNILTGSEFFSSANRTDVTAP